MEKKQDIFQKVKDLDDKKKVIEALTRLKSEVVIKDVKPGGAAFHVFALKLMGNDIVCKADTKTKSQIPKNVPSLVIIKFIANDDQYVAQCKCRTEDDFILLDISADFFKLFRRDDFRVRLPLNYKAKLKVLNAGKNLKDPEFQILDISAGGCRIDLKPGSDLKGGDQVECELLISKRDPIQVVCEVKHAIPVHDSTDKKYVGIQFIKMKTASKDKLVSLVLDIYRDVFVRNN